MQLFVVIVVTLKHSTYIFNIDRIFNLGATEGGK